MAVDIWYLARIREALACDHEQLELVDGINTVPAALAFPAGRDLAPNAAGGESTGGGQSFGGFPAYKH